MKDSRLAHLAGEGLKQGLITYREAMLLALVTSLVNGAYQKDQPIPAAKVAAEVIKHTLENNGFKFEAWQRLTGPQ